MKNLTRILHKGTCQVGLVILLISIILAIFSPFIAPYDPNEQFILKSLRPPSLSHLMGTDRYGRDIFSRVVFGARISLLVGIASISFGLLIGGFIGIVSGYVGSVLDLILQRVIDILMAFPSLVLALLISAMFKGGLMAVIFAIGIYNISRFARLVRGQVMTVKQQAYVESALAVGVPTGRIWLRYIIPNILMPILILATLRLAAAILIEASLSYLGFGVPPPTSTWGTIVADGKSFLLMAPWISLFPGVMIMSVVIGFNLLGDGLRDVFDPRLRGTY